MSSVLIAYAGALVCFLVLDGFWLGLIARDFYKKQLAHLILPSPRFVIAGIFYLVFTAAIVFLAVVPALAVLSPIGALLRGAVLGLAAYGTYDITNLSTLKGWPLKVSLVDLAWGTFITAASALAGYGAAALLA